VKADGPRASFHPSSDGAGPYVIKVRGKVEPHWESELQMSLSYAHSELGVVSVLSGQLTDQAAMLGVLGRLSMWGYLIIFVRYEYAGADMRSAS
jgi:hypothetical protein